MMPPLITVGSSFACSKIHETSEVVVVFPCDPAIVTDDFRRNISANIFALGKIGILYLIALKSSELFFLIAEEITTKSKFIISLLA